MPGACTGRTRPGACVGIVAALTVRSVLRGALAWRNNSYVATYVFVFRAVLPTRGPSR
jgi:hypothetical protein